MAVLYGNPLQTHSKHGGRFGPSKICAGIHVRILVVGH